MRIEILLSWICVHFLCLPSPGYQQTETEICKWSQCAQVSCSEVIGYPVELQSGTCLEPDGTTCSMDYSHYCCQEPSPYTSAYWVGTPPNCNATCSDCTSKGDDCLDERNRCGVGETCESGFKVLCGIREVTEPPTAPKNSSTSNRWPYGPYLIASLGLFVSCCSIAITVTVMCYICCHCKRPDNDENQGCNFDTCCSGCMPCCNKCNRYEPLQ